MTSLILVTGGTGTLGRQVVPLLREAGATLRVLSRHAQEPADGVEFVTGDLATGEGVAAALTGVVLSPVCACCGVARPQRLAGLSERDLVRLWPIPVLEFSGGSSSMST